MNEKVMMAVILVSVAVASALMLAGINQLSSEVIKKSRERNFKTAIINVLTIPLDGREVEMAYEANIEEVKVPEGTIYLAVDRSRPVKKVKGAAFSITGPGFWGPISVMVGVDASRLAIQGIEILDQAETPGLGARIEEAEFREQFRGKRMDSPIEFKIKGAAPGPNDVSAITGATLTSKYLEAIINEKSRLYIEAIRRLDLG